MTPSCGACDACDACDDCHACDDGRDGGPGPTPLRNAGAVSASLLRRVARAARRLPERLLHPARRSAVRRRVRAVPAQHLLFLCYGNICRSPFAAAAAHRAAPERTVVSAGLYGPGRPAPDAAIDAARRRGLDLAGHRSQLVTADLCRAADLTVVVDPAHCDVLARDYGVPRARMVLLGAFDPRALQLPGIADPYGQPPAVFDDCFARIDRCVEALLADAGREGGPS